jgi:hypothetical protein
VVGGWDIGTIHAPAVAGLYGGGEMTEKQKNALIRSLQQANDESWYAQGRLNKATKENAKLLQQFRALLRATKSAGLLENYRDYLMSGKVE